MNRVVDILSRLKQKGVQLWLEDGELRFRAEKEGFDATAREEVNALKEDIKAFLASAAPEASGTIPRTAPAKSYPLSYAQQRMWFLDLYEQRHEVYHCPAAIPLRGPIDPLLIERTLNYLAERHPSLRTVYALREGEPVQHVAPARPLTLTVRDFTAAPSAVATAEARAAELIREPFDLADGPLWRAELFELARDDYCLVWVIHHIATDGWSMGVLAREFTGIYRAFLRGEAPTLPPLPVQYADYAVWQREDIERRVLPSQLPYWTRRLADAPAETGLPTDFPRPAVRDGRGSVYRSRLPGSLPARVESAAQHHRVTPFMLLLAVFKVLVMRYSGQEDLVIGTPVANRQRPELTGLVGYFVNTLAIRTQADRNASFADYMQQVRAACIGAYAHQEVPFELLVGRLSGTRDLSRTPLFQIMFSLQNAAEGLLGAAGPVQLRQDIAKFDFNLTLTLFEGAYALECEYATALFTADTIARLFGHYALLLEAVITHPDRPLAHYTLLSEDERKDLMAMAAGPVESLTNAAPVHVFFERCARRDPDAPALRFRGAALSYRQLDRLAGRTAQRLRSAGLGPGGVAALCLERSVELVVSILAVLKCGAAYLPIDPESPPARTAFMVDDAGTQLALITPETAPALSECALPILAWGIDLDLSDGADLPAPPVNTPLDALAYVIYTSGTTGRPKGVGNSHLALCNRLFWMQANHPIGPRDRVLQKTNYTFDVSVWEFLWPLMQGAVLVLAEPGGHRDPSYLASTIEEEGITVCHFVPSMLSQFLEKSPRAQLGSLSAVFASGEALPGETVRRFRVLDLKAQLYNLYGPTEAAIDVSVWDCVRPAVREGVVPIGRPITNIELQVLDADLQALPVGIPGELHIGGVGLAIGYLARPGLTAERFIPHPFGPPGSRLYKTGDLARWLPDGAIEYLGRLDFQVKLRGLRIEIGEIEHHLVRHPGVAQCAVVLSRTPAGEDVLVAYVQPTADMPSIEELRGLLRSFLPEYMVPARFEHIATWPLNTNGKLDRRQLTARPFATVARVDFGTANASERLVQGIWASVLQLERVGVEQNFFELGGNSLVMVRVHQALTEQLGRDLPLVKLFAHPTVRSLARYLDDVQDETALCEQEIESDRIGRRRLRQMQAQRER